LLPLIIGLQKGMGAVTLAALFFVSVIDGAAGDQ